MPKGIYYDEGSQIINALLQKKRLTERDYYRQFGFQKGLALLEKNVFALLDSGVVTFQSRLIEKFCESEQDLWQTKGED